VVLTHYASPYQIELFDELARVLPGDLSVYYLHGTHSTRKWGRAIPRHRATVLADGPSALERARVEFQTRQLAVFNYYAESPAGELLRLRRRAGSPWSFWGERPGSRYGVLGRWRRRWKLRALHACNCPAWGIGEWAVDAYRKEFGPRRRYVNLPYFSDIQRFQALPASPAQGNARTILFSGALIPRKGVDLLADAFVEVATQCPELRLRIMGEGPLRGLLERRLSRFAGRVEFVGFRDWAELPLEYSKADFLCVPSRHDGWGLVVPEGLAAGLPVIGTDRMGAALEFIETGRNGWLLRAGDGTELVTALREAATLPAERVAAMSAAARAAVKEHSLQHGAARFLTAARDAVDHWGT